MQPESTGIYVTTTVKGVAALNAMLVPKPNWLAAQYRFLRYLRTIRRDDGVRRHRENLQFIRANIKTGVLRADIAQVVFEAGQWSERLAVGVTGEPLAKKKREALAHNAAGGEARRIRPASDYVNDILDQLKKNPRKSITDCRHATADRFGVDYKTVMNNTKAFNKKK